MRIPVSIADFNIQAGVCGIVILSIVTFFLSGCSSRDVKKTKQLERMSTDELLKYYHGVNERIRDIEMQYKMEREQSADLFEHDRVMDQAIGGKIYEMERTRKFIGKELNRRDVYPWAWPFV